MRNWNFKSILLGLAAILSAVGLVLANTNKVVVAYTDLRNKLSPKTYPYDVDVKSAKDVPSYLRSYFGDQNLQKHPDLQWFFAKMHNTSKNPLDLSVRFELRPGTCKIVHVKPGEKPFEKSLNAGSWEKKPIEPPFEWTQTDSPEECTLVLTYFVKEVNSSDEYPINDVYIRILPRQIVKWNLTDINGNEVRKEFVLASLTGWTLSKDEAVLKLAGHLAKRVGGGSPEKWTKACYEDLFQNKAGLNITPTQHTYPFQEEKRVRPPSVILSDKNPEPLEAALLMGALIHNATDEEVSFTLFVLPQPRDPMGPAVLLAWTDSSGSDTWHAIDLRLASGIGFEENLEKSTELLSHSLADNPAILDFRKHGGVLFSSNESSPNVISFQQAKAEFGILALP